MSLTTPPIRAGHAAFVALFLLAALVLLSQLGAQTKFSAKGALVAQPRFWPGVGVLGMCSFGALHLLLLWRGRDRAPGLLVELAQWARACEYLGWFMVYVWTVPLLGYLPTTLLFTPALAFRLGFRSARALTLSLLLGLAIVFVFKTGLSVRIPGGLLYETLPDGLRNLMIVYF